MYLNAREEPKVSIVFQPMHVASFAFESGFCWSFRSLPWGQTSTPERRLQARTPGDRSSADRSMKDVCEGFCCISLGFPFGTLHFGVLNFPFGE